MEGGQLRCRQPEVLRSSRPPCWGRRPPLLLQMLLLLLPLRWLLLLVVLVQEPTCAPSILKLTRSRGCCLRLTSGDTGKP